MKSKLVKATSLVLTTAMVLGTASMAFAGEYKVQKGDCLWKIAPKYSITWQTLADMNKLSNPNLIFPDQILNVPDISTVPQKEAEPEKTENMDTVVLEKTEEKSADTAVLSSLDIADISMTGTHLEPGFAPDITDYTVNVQDDIYGVKLTPKAVDGIVITVDGNELSEDGSYIVELDQSIEGYGKDYSIDAVVKATDGESETEYTIHIIRENAADTYALFTPGEYVDKETGVTLPYELYVPTNYDSAKKYPVVYVMHGAGQRNQPLDMVLKRYQSATIWAKDSEAGINECIVVSPQIVPADGNGWTKFMLTYDKVAKEANPYEMQDWAVAGYNLLQEIKSQYSVDENKIYATGLSMGGFGTYATAIAHPDEFAAIVPVCGGGDPEAISALKDKTAVWLFHAKDDPAVPFEYTEKTIAALEAADMDYKATIYDAGDIFYPNAHFSWTPAYANKDMRTWLFEQSK
ncbi:LysM peptidoglycan-binding domain-containing protein [Lachnospiraceae bacterium NSJ-143]|nr:LysM peptidoglycan-binding domain-containing protein [Lachnospiraceae bacterium NSJ-143]